MNKFILSLFLASPALFAEDITLDWAASGFSMKMGYYKPQQAALTKEKPAAVTKLPDGVGSPLYTTLSFGVADAERKVVAVLDESAPDKSRLWVDANGNGDLTDDPAAEWQPRVNETGGKKLTTWSGGAKVRISFGDQARELGLKFYRFDKADPKRATFAATLFYYRDFGLAGKANVGGKSYDAVLSDDKARGVFAGEGSDASLGLDINGDGKFDSRSERFSTIAPFNIGGTTYELAGLKPGGASFQIVKSEKTVDEKKVPVAVKAGGKAAEFEDKTTAGAAVKFPQDYKGRLVMLDFWATWCGPCIAELPNLKKVYDEFHAKGFDILGVSLDSEATLPRLKKFTEDKGMTWPQIADGKAWDARLGALYGVRSIPACFLVDGTTGALIATTEELRGERLRPTIERALAGPGKATVAKKQVEAATPKPEPESPLVSEARALTKSGTLMSAEAFLSAMKKPLPASIALTPPGTQTLSGREIAERARATHLRAGWLYQCTKCTRWHTTLAGGYAIARDTVATAHHVMNAPGNMQAGKGYPVIVRGEDDILPISTIIAADPGMDVTVLRVGVSDLKPLALSDDVRVGDDVFCLSDPRGVRDYFSTGIVNRIYVLDKKTGGEFSGERIHVSTDWAQGSSGSAVLDERGNAIGHVSRIRALLGEKPENAAAAPTAMNLHEAVPAKSVLRLITEKTNPAGSKSPDH